MYVIYVTAYCTLCMGESLWLNITTNYIGIWVSYIFRPGMLACHPSREGLTLWFFNQCSICNAWVNCPYAIGKTAWYYLKKPATCEDRLLLFRDRW